MTHTISTDEQMPHTINQVQHMNKSDNIESFVCVCNVYYLLKPILTCIHIRW
uniref:Uncharacterized protein n=1 Tax=Arion vulgaris TaxID=1028688 RepID=A0A0B7AWT4_9EUPU